MVSEAFANDTSRVPAEYNELSLMFEWGLSEKQFYEENSAETIIKLIEYKQAEAQGHKRRQSQNK